MTDKNQGGRPTDYSEEIADIILERIMDGESLRSICSADDMPSRTTVFRWLHKHKDFSDQYARAKEEQAEMFADELVSIADEQETFTKEGGEVAYDATAVARNRLRIDTRKWVVSKLKPKKYGDKQVLDHQSSDGTMSPKDASQAVLEALRAKHDAK